MQYLSKNEDDIFSVTNIRSKLYSRLRNNSFSGYNAYDFLLSPFSINIRSKILRKAGVQLFRYSPVNFRHILKIRKSKCYKSIGLIMQAACIDRDVFKANYLLSQLFDPSNSIGGDPLWGFDFPIVLSHYHSRKNEPSLIITLFVFSGLIAYYQIIRDDFIKENIIKFYNIINDNLPKIETRTSIGYSYIFNKYDPVYNATAKVGKYFALCERIGIGVNNDLKINKILNYLFANMTKDGLWMYSEIARYSDGFHTAFILDAINCMLPYSRDSSYPALYDIAKKSYYKSFILPSGQPLYYHPKFKPLDIRRYLTISDIRDCAAGIQFALLDHNYDQARKILNWTMQNMYDPKGYFYHYSERWWNNRIEYIRPQAWMYLALTLYEKYRRDHNL